MVSIFLVFLQCKPTAALWDHTITDATCWDQAVFYDFSYWVSAYTTMTDIILALLPITVFWKLQMRQSTKTGVCIMMGLTLLSAIVTIIKATYLPLFADVEDPCKFFHYYASFLYYVLLLFIFFYFLLLFVLYPVTSAHTVGCQYTM